MYYYVLPKDKKCATILLLNFKKGRINMKNKKMLWELFSTLFKIGLFTFGGGYAMIAFFESEFVEKKKWLDKEEFLDMVAIAESTPGPIAINSATYVGYKNAGVLGAACATLGVVLPSFIIIYVISLFLDAFLTFELKVWWVLLGACVVIGILIIISKLYDAKHKDSDPEFVSYKEDYFGAWKWSWKWSFNKIDKIWQIEDNSIVAHCPNCETPMLHDRYETSFECPRCQFKTDHQRKHKTSQEVKVLIIDNVMRRNSNNI